MALTSFDAWDRCRLFAIAPDIIGNAVLTARKASREMHYRERRILNRAIQCVILVSACALCLGGAIPAAHADDLAGQDREYSRTPDLWPALAKRPSLLGGQDGPKDALQTRGINVDLWVTQYYQGLVSGSATEDWEYGAKADAFITFDGAKLGLWRGLFVSLHQEWEGGESVNGRNGTLLPINTALAIPRLGGRDQELSLLVTQAFNEHVSLSVGKFNMLDLAAKTPLLGGGGVDTFMNVGLAAPITGMTPPYLLGASLTITTQPAVFNIFVYDPRNAQNWDVIAHPFSEGTTIMGSATVPVKIGGLHGFQAVRGIYSTRDGFNLSDVPELALPPESQGVIGMRDDRWYFAYSFQQYLYQDPTDPKRGWGLFGQFGLSDGNPNPLHGNMLIGLAGTSFLAGRTLDRWGIGYFRYNLSDDLKNGLETIGIPLRDEQGVEAFYNVAVTPWMRWTVDAQYIRPTVPGREDGVFLGLRNQMKF